MKAWGFLLWLFVSCGALVVACGDSGSSVFPIPTDDASVDQTAPPPPPLGGDSSTDARAGGCSPLTCAKLGYNCGPAGDGCGSALNCGTCASPETCGGGGKFSQCGGTSGCVPTTCAKLGFTCGPAGDGCGGQLNCGMCTGSQTCGGGGKPSECGGFVPPDGGLDGGACVPLTCAQQNIACGPAGDGCGNLLQCGACAAPDTCGGGGTLGTCGHNTSCVPKTCAQLGFNCGFAGDGCGGQLQCGACTMPFICGGGGVPGVCGDSNLGDAGCTGLCKQQVTCDSGGTTTVTGTVYAPTDASKGYGNPDPLYDALVYIPNGTVQPFPPGVSCDQCGAQASGNPLVTYTTGPDGKFTLTNAPCGTNIPMVIQLGRWRRQIVIPNVACCANTALTPAQTRLPRNHTEGDIPLIAFSTGSADPIECVLPKIGIDTAEFTNPNGTGRVRMYQDNGATINGATPAASTLYTSAAELAKYDMIIFDCVGGEVDKTAGNQANVINYANIGGRVFASHFSYVWLYNDVPFNSTAAWNINQAYPPDPMNAFIDVTSQKGMDFATWLGVVGALAGPNQITVQAPRHDSDKVNVPPSQQFVYADPIISPKNPLEFTFNTPILNDGGPQCGRVLFSDFHVNTGGAGSGTFPGECPVAPMTPQEKVLEFMLFDLSSCVVQTGPPPPQCTPLSCGSQGFNCGPAGDGCGNLLQCGSCSGCQVCGGGGMPGVCGGTCCVPHGCGNIMCGPTGDGCGGQLNCGTCPNGQTCGGGGQNGQCGSIDGGSKCVPETCKSQNINCGPAGDGCGGLLQCGTCPNGQTCGGGGQSGQCGMPMCTPKTCAELGINCGPSGDGCGGQLNCGTCTPPMTCGGGGAPGVCGGGTK